MFLSVFGKTILVVNTYQVANDLFEKRSSNYSDRNELPMINDLYAFRLDSQSCVLTTF